MLVAGSIRDWVAPGRTTPTVPRREDGLPGS